MFISKLALSPPRLIGVLVVAVMLTACTDNQPTAPPPTQVMRMVGRSSLTLPTLNVPTTTFAMPDINVTDTDEDMCADVPGLCGNTVCPAGDITGPSSDRKGTGFSLIRNRRKPRN